MVCNINKKDAVHIYCVLKNLLLNGSVPDRYRAPRTAPRSGSETLDHQKRPSLKRVEKFSVRYLKQVSWLMDQRPYRPSHAVSGTMAIAFNGKNYPKYSSSSVQDSHLFPYSACVSIRMVVDFSSRCSYRPLEIFVFLNILCSPRVSMSRKMCLKCVISVSSENEHIKRTLF